VYGPYSGNSFAYFLNDHWTAAVFEPDGGYTLYNGEKIAGPFSSIGFTLPDTKRAGSPWIVSGYNSNTATLVINDKIRYEQSGIGSGGWSSISATDDGAFWALRSRDTNGNVYLVDNGNQQGPLPKMMTSQIISSPSKDKSCMTFIASDDRKNYIAIDGIISGPSIAAMTPVFSFRGGMWAVSAAQDSGTKKLLLPGSPAETYDDIREMQRLGEDNVVVYNGVRDGNCFPGVNDVRLGAFTNASINCSTRKPHAMYLATDEGDNVVKVSMLTVSFTPERSVAMKKVAKKVVPMITQDFRCIPRHHCGSEKNRGH
jgi:hypothetical protein